jgi:hypothetical protein
VECQDVTLNNERHRNALSKMQRYTAGADRRRLADQAMAKKRRSDGNENAHVKNIEAPLHKRAPKSLKKLG